MDVPLLFDAIEGRSLRLDEKKGDLGAIYENHAGDRTIVQAVDDASLSCHHG